MDMNKINISDLLTLATAG